MSKRIYIRLDRLRAVAATMTPGYIEEVLDAGHFGAPTNGVSNRLYLDRDEWERLCLKHSPRGLGDRVARVAKPIARVIDGVLGTNVVNCPGCGKRQEDWNKTFPTK